MNITPIFNQVLASHNAQPVEPYVFRVENLDEFLKEAYRIVGHVTLLKLEVVANYQQRTHITKLHTDLKSIRQSYLSTAPPPRRKQYARPNNTSTTADKDSKYLTDTQRNEIDAQAKQSLRELNHAINVLRDAEGIRQTTVSQVALRKRAKQGLGALGRWAAGGAITAKSPEEELEEANSNMIKAHRESIIWSLQNALEQCGQFQSSMMEIRLMREVEKSKSVLYKTRAIMPSDGYGSMDGGSRAGDVSKDYRGLASHGQDESSAAIEQQLDPEQLQLFAQENQDMLKQYEDQLDKVRYVSDPPAHQAITNHASAPPKSRSWRSQSCSRPLQAISRCSLRTLSSSWRIRSIQRRMSEAGTGNSSGRLSEEAQRNWSFTARLPSAPYSSCGTCSYDKLKCRELILHTSAARKVPSQSPNMWK